jgi:hypothetical protein
VGVVLYYFAYLFSLFGCNFEVFLGYLDYVWMVELACCSSWLSGAGLFEACWFGYLDYFASRTVRVVSGGAG